VLVQNGYSRSDGMYSTQGAMIWTVDMNSTYMWYHRYSACTIEFHRYPTNGGSILKGGWNEQNFPTHVYSCSNTIGFQWRRDLHECLNSAQQTCDTMDTQPVRLNFQQYSRMDDMLWRVPTTLHFLRPTWVSLTDQGLQCYYHSRRTKNGSAIDRQTVALWPQP
jgi:hypothetical protein